MQRGKTIVPLIEESLKFYGIKSRASVLGLVQRARTHSALTEAQAMAIA